MRRAVGSVFKAETVDESFEDLLMKYKQIQLELECIRKEERIALKEDEDALDQSPAGTDSGPSDVKPEEPVSAVTEKKVFQAFNIRPLRQKLLTPAERDALNASAVPDVQLQEDEEMQKNSTSQNDGIVSVMYTAFVCLCRSCELSISVLFCVRCEG